MRTLDGFFPSHEHKYVKMTSSVLHAHTHAHKHTQLLQLIKNQFAGCYNLTPTILFPQQPVSSTCCECLGPVNPLSLQDALASLKQLHELSSIESVLKILNDDKVD